MPTYVITCPACKQRFKASKMPPIDKPFVCPKCGYYKDREVVVTE